MWYIENFNSDLLCQIYTNLSFSLLDKSEVEFHKVAMECQFSFYNLLKNTSQNLNIHFTIKMHVGTIV